MDGPRDTVERAAELLGGAIDKVFYNAGVLIAHPLAEWSADDWDLTTAVNLRAPFLIAQAAEPYLLRSGEGRLVFTASAGALRGHAGMPAYHATKSGLLGLVRSLADEFGPHGVTVNAICTRRIRLRRSDRWSSPSRSAVRRSRRRSSAVCSICSAKPPDTSPARRSSSTAGTPRCERKTRR